MNSNMNVCFDSKLPINWTDFLAMSFIYIVIHAVMTRVLQTIELTFYQCVNALKYPLSKSKCSFNASVHKFCLLSDTKSDFSLQTLRPFQKKSKMI